MARTHARLLTSIWTNPDFIALDPLAQRAYILALSQPGVSFCGIVSYTARRWARFAAGTTPEDIDQAVATLVEARFVLLDEDTEELMIRSFCKNDGVLTSPNILVSMSRNDFELILSERLRNAFLEGFPEGFLEGLTDTVRNGLGERFREGLRQGVLARASRTHDAEPLPLPRPYPSPPPGGGTLSVLRDGSAGANGGEGNAQGNGKSGPPPWAGDRHSERWATFVDRVVTVLGPRHFAAAVALVDRWRSVLDHHLIDQAIFLAEHAEKPARSIAYFEKTLATTAAQHDVDVPAIPAESAGA